MSTGNHPHAPLGTATEEPLEVARDLDLGEFGDLTDSERIVGNRYRAYAELGGAERGVAIDMRAALTDLVAYNGGKPLTCHA